MSYIGLVFARFSNHDRVRSYDSSRSLRPRSTKTPRTEGASGGIGYVTRKYRGKAPRPSRTLEQRSPAFGWVLLPLRIFLGGTFTFAGLQKLANVNFFNSANPASIQAQLHAYERLSPIHSLLVAASHVATFVGLTIALGELAVGLGTLLGVMPRLAATGGMLIAISFFLSVSFHSNPYYTGADIVFAFAWTPLLLRGDGGVLSLGRALKVRQGLAQHYVPVELDFSLLSSSCMHRTKSQCGINNGRSCRHATCPLLGIGARDRGAVPLRAEKRSGPEDYDGERRRFMAGGAAVSAVGVTALVSGGLSAFLGRIFSHASIGSSTQTLSSSKPVSSSSTTTSSPSTTAPSTTTAGPSSKQNTGVLVGPSADVPLGKVASFSDPATGAPAYVTHPTSTEFRAFSAICPHAGCTVEYASGNLFVCPCHGSEFDGTTGAVLSGPAVTGLSPIVISLGSNGDLYADGSAPS